MRSSPLHRMKISTQIFNLINNIGFTRAVAFFKDNNPQYQKHQRK